MEGLPVALWDAPYLRRPSFVPKEDISHDWKKIHGADDWRDPFNPLHPSVVAEIQKYGQFDLATYDAYEFHPYSKNAGGCRYEPSELFSKLGLESLGYEVASYVYATVVLPPWGDDWLVRSLLTDSTSVQSHWMGFIAVSNEDETRRIGRRDILVAWRGTEGTSEWFKDAEMLLVPLEKGVCEGAQVEWGFQSIYTAKCDGQKSASEQVMTSIRALVKKYHDEKKEVVSLTVTGHSLGGALALLNAHEAAAIPGLSHVSVFSFGAPKVGNSAFCAKVDQARVKMLRVVINHDLVPMLPFFPGYQHAGTTKCLKSRDDLFWYVVYNHSLETYLQLLESPGHQTALQSSGSNMTVWRERVRSAERVRERWYRMAVLGFVRGPPEWAWDERETEDEPNPLRTMQTPPTVNSL